MHVTYRDLAILQLNYPYHVRSLQRSCFPRGKISSSLSAEWCRNRTTSSFDNGVVAVFGTGANVLDAAQAVLNLLEGKRRNN